MIRLIYLSLADIDLSLSDVQDILKTARTHNAKAGVSGLLYFDNQYFLQALEGEPAIVTPLYDHIAEDFRHSGTQVLCQDEISERAFSGWDMGYASLSESVTTTLSNIGVSNQSGGIKNINAEQSLQLLLALKDVAEKNS